MRGIRALDRLPKLVIAATLAIALVSFGLWWEDSHAGGPARRDVDPSVLLSPTKALAMDGPLATLKLTAPVTRNVESSYGPTVGRWWIFGDVSVNQLVIKHADPSEEASRLKYADPRKYNLSEYPRRTGPAITPQLAGSPNSSYYFCAWVTAQGCEAWTWTARYGQYGILVKYEGNTARQPAPLPENDFDRLVHGIASHIASRL